MASSVHRTLRVVTPILKGPDVKELQRALNKSGHFIDVDGEFGPHTYSAAHEAMYVLGASRKRLRSHAVDPHAQRLIRFRHPTVLEKRRASWRSKHTNGPKKAISWAASQVGVTEHPAGSNRGHEVDQWENAVDMIGQPWCGAFVHAASKLHSTARGLTPRTRYVPYIESDGKGHTNGYAGFYHVSQGKPGDHVVFGFGKSYGVHTGLLVQVNSDGSINTIEGNTSFGAAGSQDNGGAVARRTRSFADVRGVARPRYH